MSYNAPPPPPPRGGGQPPENNLVWAILVTLFCCLPFGIVSIVKAASVNGKWMAGDVAGANQAAAEAKKWAIWGAIAFVAQLVIVIGILVVVVAAGTTTSTSTGY